MDKAAQSDISYTHLEIEHPAEVMSSEMFHNLVRSYGITGETPEERLTNFKSLSKEQLALMITDINRGVLGSSETQVNEEQSYVRDSDTKFLAPDVRYEIFTHVINLVRNAPNDINPQRVSDALALGVVLLHPFKDGNGRTARLVGYLLHTGFDGEFFDEDFKKLAGSRDKIRDNGGGYMINSYVPGKGQIADQASPDDVISYIDRLFEEPPGPFEVGH